MQLDCLVVQPIPVQGVSMPRVVPRSGFSSPSIGKGHTSITAGTPRRFSLIGFAFEATMFFLCQAIV